ncbi:fluoride efflux transporter FluC [Lacticaseibacillus porcinae]|uniref:fluoride efflux transporter FluC n=1 Tax=Lacticaseibacillus porcinae TaxID=1123687 RepID=UPI000F7A307C|nr:CrcB family protein [Lacticaseibacillus porcinae]
MNLLMVGIGAGFGALLRYALTQLGKIVWPTRPWMTMVINVTGAFVAGWVSVMGLPNHLHLLIATGLLGGYTTFSTLHVDTLGLINRKLWPQVFGYYVGTVILGVLAASLGIWLGR